jgi:integrase/recombinase XerD
VITLQNSASKGKSGGVIWMNEELKAALAEYQAVRTYFDASDRIIKPERGQNTSAQVIVNMFQSRGGSLCWLGCRCRHRRLLFLL